MNKHNPIHGGHYLIRGLHIIFQPGLKRFVFVPLTINFFIYVLFIAVGYHFAEKFIYWVDHLLPHWLHWLNWLLWPLFIIIGLVVIIYSFSVISNLITAPFNSFLSEKVVYIVTGKKNADESWHAIFKLIPHALAREGRKLLYYLPRVIVLLIVSFIPIVNLVITILWLWLACWMTAVQYLDYPMDNDRISFTQMIRHLKAHYLSNLGFGAIVLLALFIPFFNIVMIPAAVAGATLKWLDEQAQQ